MSTKTKNITGFSLKETKKIKKELQKLGFRDFKESGKILHFCTKKHSFPTHGFDYDKNEFWMNNYISVAYKAGVNPGGIGDGKKPNIAMTYTINLCIHGRQRNFRCREYNSYSREFRGFYKYSRDLQDLISKLKNFLEVNFDS